MPKVGGKKFPYTKEGEKAAKAYAGKTGDSVDKYYAGGSVTDARQRGQTYQMGGVVDPFSSRNPQNVGLSPEGDPTMPSSPIPPPENQLGDNPVIGAAAPAPGAVEEGEAPPAIPGAPAMSGGSPPNVMGEADAPQMKFGGLVTTDARDRKQTFEEGGQVKPVAARGKYPQEFAKRPKSEAKDVTDVVKESKVSTKGEKFTKLASTALGGAMGTVAGHAIAGKLKERRLKKKAKKVIKGKKK